MRELAETMSRALNSLSRRLLPDRLGAWQKNREIDAMLKRDPMRRFSVMILLAGDCNSGKSAVLRQLRLISGPAFNHKELLEFKETIYDNVVQGMKELVYVRHYLDIPLQNSANEKHEKLFSSLRWCMKLEPCTFQSYVEAIDSLWKDSGIQEAFFKRNNCELMYESPKYYFDNIHRIGKLNYLPHNQDVIHAQKHRRTLADQYVVLPDSRFAAAYLSRNMVVRGALKTAFQTPVLFIVGCSDYDRISCGNNYLVESLQFFECLCKDKRFLYSNIIVFFNKMDLLAEKIQTSDIRKHFPEFQGDPHKLEDVQEFLVQSFLKRKGSNSRQIFYYMTTAVDTENFRKVFESVKDVILRNVLWQCDSVYQKRRVYKLL